MTIVNGFDIDTPEGAKAYLESEGIDVEQCIKDGIEVIERTKKALNLANENNRSEHLVCPECRSNDCKMAIHTDYKECNKCYHYWE